MFTISNFLFGPPSESEFSVKITRFPGIRTEYSIHQKSTPKNASVVAYRVFNRLRDPKELNDDTTYQELGSFSNLEDGMNKLHEVRTAQSLNFVLPNDTEVARIKLVYRSIFAPGFAASDLKWDLKGMQFIYSQKP